MSAQIYLSDSNGKILTQIISKVEIGYIDGDKMSDSLYYNFNTESIIVSLSSLNYIPLEVPYLLEVPCIISIGVNQGGFYIRESCTRNFITYEYNFENKSGRFRLVGFFQEYLGNATNDGMGTFSLDLVTSDFRADWYYWDNELDSLILMPTITSNFRYPSIYIDDDTYVPSDSLFSYHKKESIIKNRINNISKDFFFNKEIKTIPLSELKDVVVDSLFLEYGNEMYYDTDKGLNLVKDKTKSDSDFIIYKNIQLYKNNNYTINLISFDFGFNNIFYVLHYFNKNNAIHDISLFLNANQFKTLISSS